MAKLNQLQFGTVVRFSSYLIIKTKCKILAVQYITESVPVVEIILLRLLKIPKEGGQNITLAEKKVLIV